MSQVPKAQGKRTDKKPTDTAVGKYDVIKETGFTPKQVERFETLAANLDMVEQAKACCCGKSERKRNGTQNHFSEI